MKKSIFTILILFISFQISYAQYNTWTPTSTVDAPQGRGYFTTVWTGSKMIVWGGWNVFGGGGNLNTGGLYDPETNTWTATSLVNAPTGRNIHCAVWTGTKMIVWGGFGYDSLGNLNNLNTGGIYDPATDTWEPTSTVNAPPPSGWATAVWTGSKMIVWGGNVASGGVSTGGIYDPATDTWEPTSIVDAPSARTRQTAVWTGSKMIVWGGWGGFGLDPAVKTGGIYDPTTDTWEQTDTLTAPSKRYMHTAVWTGSKMIVWGGNPVTNAIQPLHTGGIFDPETNTWQPTDTLTAPPGRYEHSAVWSGRTMIVWGGAGQSGGIYNPETDNWQLTDTVTAPSARANNLAVWTGSKMIIWGGWMFPFDFNTGGVYTPWLLTPLAPSNLFAVADTFSVDLNWDDNSDNEIGFKIERKDDSLNVPGTWTLIDSVGANGTTFTDIGLTPNTVYSYRIYAYNEAGNSMGDSVETVTIVPVELTSFTASVSGNNVSLNWSTSTETNNKGFEVQRSEISNQISVWDKIGYVGGFGTTTETKSYSFTDNNVSTGKYTYRLKQIDFNGSYKYSKSVEANVELPLTFSLSQNFPNPFNPTTQIEYSIPKDGIVKLGVYNILGQEVAELVGGNLRAGSHKIIFNAQGLASGVYYYRLESGGNAAIKKLLLIK